LLSTATEKFPTVKPIAESTTVATTAPINTFQGFLAVDLDSFTAVDLLLGSMSAIDGENKSN